jgi:hypothetical protein
MSPEKVISVIEMYEKKLSQAGIPKTRMDPKRTFASLSRDEILTHAHFLTDGAKEYARRGNLRKMGSHLTVIQMCLSFVGWYTLEQLMNHNRPDVEKATYIEKSGLNPRSFKSLEGWRYIPRGYELYRSVLKVLQRQQEQQPDRFVLLDEFLEDEGVLSCYTPNRLIRFCSPPDFRRARRAIRGSIGYLRKKGHIIESTKEFGQIAYRWCGE